jgi:hypothetical protein
LEGRTKVAFPHHISPTYPAVSTDEEWRKVSSSKVELLVKLVQHHLLDDSHQKVDWMDVDGLSVPIWKDGSGCPVDAQDVDDSLMAKGTRKILVYHEFTMMTALLVSVGVLT